MEYLYLILCFITSIFITPIVKNAALRWKITDKPNDRKVHKKNIPILGGLAIYISFMIGLFVSRQDDPHMPAIMIGSLIIVITGVLDDIFILSARYKLIGQLFAATVAVIGSFTLEFIHLPFGGVLNFGFLSVPLTILWIVGITNAINLIDGLDGLAAGVSSIALITISIMAFLQGDTFVLTIALLVLGSTLGFLFYNFHPAKIFMGDTGALFLGYMIAILALLGSKNVTFFTLVIPVIILGVPISDTFLAIIRRGFNKQPISAPDKKHFHHFLLNAGFTHRQAVLIVYAVAFMFSLSAIIFSMATIWGSILVVFLLLVGIELFVESFGLVSKDYKPLLRLMRLRSSGRYER
ncbi:glycosyltransferase family 4 protein [Bacillus sp. FSL K6-3431]|uniref:glycosyltransferase family 4 protein n=1 Tax=Bacillus sp. FSL K6-3431 TaxID=2921500 RepID=UPI0030F643BD